MNTTKRSIVTFEFDDKELMALSIARDLLYEVFVQIDGEYLENAEKQDSNLNAEDVVIAREVIKILINGGVPSNWEMEE